MQPLITALLLFAADLDPVVVPGESKPTATRFAEALRLAEEGKSDRALNVLIGLLESGADDLINVGPGRSARAREQEERRQRSGGDPTTRSSGDNGGE